MHQFRMLLAGILLKMGGYALLRFNVQILPEVHLQIAPALIILGIINIIYGALNVCTRQCKKENCM